MLSKLNPRDIQGDGVPLSSEEVELLRDYNLRIQQAELFSYNEDVDNILERLLVLRPFNPVLLLGRIDLLSLKYQALSQNDELLCTLNTLLSLESFLSDDAMNFDQIRIRALRSQIYLKKQASDSTLLSDLTYIIEHVNPVQEEHYLFDFYYDALHARSKIYKAQGRLEEELSDLNRLLTPPFFNSQKHLLYEPYGNVHAYSRRGLHRRSEIFVMKEQYDDALRDLNALLCEDPDDAPALVSRNKVYQMLNQPEKALEDELALRDQMLRNLEYAEESRAIPSLQTLAKITFFRHEANIDTSEWVASAPVFARGLLDATGITPEAMHSMRTLLYVEAPVKKTVFDDLAMHENAADDNKKRNHDAISPSMS